MERSRREEVVMEVTSIVRILLLLLLLLLVVGPLNEFEVCVCMCVPLYSVGGKGTHVGRFLKGGINVVLPKP